MRNELPALALLLLAAACSPATQRDNHAAADVGNASASAAPTAAPTPPPATNAAGAEPPRHLPPVEPPAPGTPGGLADDRRPVSEARFSETSPQGAANVVQTYFALLEAGRYGEAWKLWANGGEASGMSRAAFAASFARYAEYHAQVGAPGEVEGAAGSLYVEVPVVVYGRLKSGEPVHMKGPITLRRVNDVPGSTAEQRQWHVQESGLKPQPR